MRVRSLCNRFSLLRLKLGQQGHVWKLSLKFTNCQTVLRLDVFFLVQGKALQCPLVLQGNLSHQAIVRGGWGRDNPDYEGTMVFAR